MSEKYLEVFGVEFEEAYDEDGDERYYGYIELKNILGDIKKAFIEEIGKQEIPFEKIKIEIEIKLENEEKVKVGLMVYPSENFTQLQIPEKEIIEGILEFRRRIGKLVEDIIQAKGNLKGKPEVGVEKMKQKQRELAKQLLEKLEA